MWFRIGVVSLLFLSFSPAPLLPRVSGSLVIDAGSSTLFAINPESGYLSAVDIATDTVRRETKVGINSHSLALSADERTLYVTNQDSATVAVIDAVTLKPRGSVRVDAEPYGIVADHSSGRVYVASSAIAVVDVLEIAFDDDPFWDYLLNKRAHVRPIHASIVGRIPVAPNPKGLALSGDGTRLYVTHFFSGDVSVIDTAQHRVIQSVSTGDDSNMAQSIAIHPANGRAYLPHIRSNVSNPFLLFDTTIFPTVSVIDLARNQAVPQERTDLSVGLTSVNLPYDTAFSADGRFLYCANLGSGDVAVVDIATQRRLAVIDVGEGPRGIRVTPDGRKAYVLNSLSDNISVLNLQRLEETARIRIAANSLPEDVRRGKVLFFSSRSSDISRDRWMSCASCHFEGGIDGRTWKFAAGLRNTTSMAGVDETLPLHWSADRDEVQDFEHTIRTLQAGRGLVRGRDANAELGPPNAGLSSDLDAMAAYARSVRPRPSPFSTGDAVQRGRAIFSRADVACASCHPAPRYTDRALHDVGTGDVFDTPSLRGVWDSAPYFHDGSAATLRGAISRHTKTSHLSESELQDLIAFLLSL